MIYNQAIIFSLVTMITVLHSKKIKKEEVVYIKNTTNDDKNNNILDTIYTKVNKSLTKVCDMFSLNLTSAKFEHFKLLMDMYHDLKPILDGLPSFYSNITQASRVKIFNTSNDQIKIYIQVIEETLIETENRTDKMRSVSDEMFELVEVINNLTFDDVFGSYNETIEKDINIAITGILNPKMVYNFKKWRQSHSDEFLTHNSSRRMLRARETTIKDYPFIVSIHAVGEFMCAGSIVSKNLIVTAASCLQSAPEKAIDPRLLTVRVGSDFSKKDGELIPINDIYVHPDYDTVLLKNNIAIARMSRYNLKKKFKIRRIEYARMEGQLPDYITNIEILGWGDKEDPEATSQQFLSITHLDIIEINRCKKSYSTNFVSDKNFCAGSLKRSEGTCKRDMGGPAFVSSVLVGVISFGPPTCGVPNAPIVFTNIGDYADWIDSIDNLTHTTRLSSKQSLRDQKMTFTETHLGKKQQKLRNSLNNYPHAVILLTSLISGILHKTHTKIRKDKYKRKNREHEDPVIINPNNIIQVLSRNPKILQHYVTIIKSWLRSGVPGESGDLFHDFESKNFWAPTTRRLHEVDKNNPTEPSVLLSALYDSINEDTDQLMKPTTLSLQNYKSLADMAMSVSPITFPTESVLLDMFAQIPQIIPPLLDKNIQDTLSDLEEIAEALYEPEKLKTQINIESNKIRHKLRESIDKQYSGVQKGKDTLPHNSFTRYSKAERKKTTMLLPKTLLYKNLSPKKKEMEKLDNEVLHEYESENYEAEYDRNEEYNTAEKQNYNQLDQSIENADERSDLKQEFSIHDLEYDNDNNYKMQNLYPKTRLRKPKNNYKTNLEIATQKISSKKYNTLFQKTGMSFTAEPKYLVDYDTFHENAHQYGDGQVISQEKKIEDYLLNLNIS